MSKKINKLGIELLGFSTVSNESWYASSALRVLQLSSFKFSRFPPVCPWRPLEGQKIKKANRVHCSWTITVSRLVGITLVCVCFWTWRYRKFQGAGHYGYVVAGVWRHDDSGTYINDCSLQTSSPYIPSTWELYNLEDTFSAGLMFTCGLHTLWTLKSIGNGSKMYCWWL